MRIAIGCVGYLISFMPFCICAMDLTGISLANNSLTHFIDKSINDAFINAIRKNRSTLAKFFKTLGADVNVRTNKGCTPLHCAILVGSTELSKWLLAQGAQLDAVNQDGIGVLMFAADKGNVDIVNYCLTQNQLVNQMNYKKRTALMYAARSGRLRVMEMLLNNGALIDFADADYRTPLHHCVRASSSNRHIRQTIRLLIRAGADINRQDLKGQTPLMYAAEYNFPIMSTLLDCGADVCIQDHDGMSAFLLATANGNIGPMAQLCVRATETALFAQKNKDGLDALALAIHEADEIKQFLTDEPFREHTIEDHVRRKIKKYAMRGNVVYRNKQFIRTQIFDAAQKKSKYVNRANILYYLRGRELGLPMHTLE